MKRKRSIKEVLKRREKKAFDHSNEVMIGKIVGVHGIKGEVKVKSESDVFERQMEVLEKVPIYRGTKKEELQVESMRQHKGLYIIKFKDISDRTEAEERIGGEIWIDRSKQVELEEGEFYVADLIGCEVFTEEGRKVGVVKGVLEQPASHVLEVESVNGKELLIPFINQFVKEVDVNKKRIVVSLIEGMEE